MRRRQTSRQAEPAPAPVAVHAIEPTGVYFPDQFRALFRVKQTTLRREVREGRLRIAKRAGRYYLLGEWILEWLRAGELKRQPHGVDLPWPAAVG